MSKCNIKFLSSLHHSPRQFEFHSSGDNILYGTITGRCYLSSLNTSELIDLGEYSIESTDSILAISWLKSSPEKFIVGSANGKITIEDIDFKNNQQSVRNEFSNFPDLTSLHINCNDTSLIASGHTDIVNIYDIETRIVVSSLSKIHDDHINISRFSNNNPNIFATSSFDKSAKLWDMRTLSNPIYTIKSPSSLLMLTFSPNDNFLLTSGADNCIIQVTFFTSFLSY